MNALEVLHNIQNNKILRNANLKYCLVSSSKKPFKLDGTLARPNEITDFSDLSEVEKCNNLEDYAGLGISIQASNICAIDVDKCFSRPFDFSSADERAIDVVERFLDKAYIEFSFSGKGLRVFYRQEDIDDYSENYYTKAEEYGIEYYQPTASYRYVTITGKTIANNEINSKENFRDTILDFINKYMKRKFVIHRSSENEQIDNRSLSELLTITLKLILKKYELQERWFDTQHYAQMVNGELQSRESHNDYHLMALLYENVTQDREKLRLIFEQSPYFKSKDVKHVLKWKNQDYRYYNYQFDMLIGKRRKRNV